jgi:hypothetical protein
MIGVSDLRGGAEAAGENERGGGWRNRENKTKQ